MIIKLSFVFAWCSLLYGTPNYGTNTNLTLKTSTFDQMCWMSFVLGLVVFTWIRLKCFECTKQPVQQGSNWSPTLTRGPIQSCATWVVPRWLMFHTHRWCPKTVPQYAKSGLFWLDALVGHGHVLQTDFCNQTKGKLANTQAKHAKTRLCNIYKRKMMDASNNKVVVVVAVAICDRLAVWPVNTVKPFQIGWHWSSWSIVASLDNKMPVKWFRL